MAHMISKIDKQQGIEQAWHGLTEVLSEINLEDNFLTSWDVEQANLFINAGKLVKLPFKIFRCTDDKSITIGKPFAETYIPIKNNQFLDIIKDAVKGNGFTVSSIGSVCERAKIFCSVKLAEMEEFTIGNRTFKNYLNFLSSHDGSSPFYVNTSNICTVCNNTFTANMLQDTEGDNLSIKVKHTKNSTTRLENLAEIVDAAIGVAAQFKAAMEKFTEIEVNKTQAERIYTGFIVPSKELVSTRAKNSVNRMVELFQTGAGNKGENLSDVFNGLTDFYTHESAGGKDIQKQYISSEFGSAMSKKQEFFQALTTDFSTLEKRGERLMAAVEA